MTLTETYVVGDLEHIGEENGMIAVRIKNCGPKTRVYRIKEVTGYNWEGNIYGEFDKDAIKFSHSLWSFAQGDKVKLVHHFGDDENDDRYTLENLSLASAEIAGLDELKSKKFIEKLSCIEVVGTLQHIGWGRTNVCLRLKCRQKKLVFYDDGDISERIEKFDKEFYGDISKNLMSLDAGFKTLAAYKKGDKVRLSRYKDGSFEFDNLTLGVFNRNRNYKSHNDL